MNTQFVTSENLQHSDYPWCHVESLCNPETVGAKKLLLVRAIMPAHDGHNFHKHPEREEIIYVIAGQAEQWVGKEKRLLKPGEMALIPADTPHATFNPGPDNLVFLAILSPVEAAGEFTIDVFDQEPWKTLRPPLRYPRI
jgi:quercetin dioxygenase-like cupin family protein